MLFSIVTPSLNCGEFIRHNFASVRKQGFGPDKLEQWVIDGGSTDGTLDILKQEPNVKWVSERDQGLSDAVNKGIQRAKGEWIIWLNADDMLADNALEIFLGYTRRYPDARIFEGSLTYLGYDGSIEQTMPASAHRLEDLLGTETGMNQASTIVHREVFDRVGLLDVTDRYAMDYEWLVRAMHHYQCTPIPEVLTYYRRRKNSITDIHLDKQFERFLAIRRRFRQPYFCRAEFRIRFYLYTEPLRRIRWLRRSVRNIKGLFGFRPIHPMK